MVRPRRVVAAVLAVTAAVLTSVAFVSVAPAAAITPFTSRFQANDNGAVLTIGNNLLTCPPRDARCSAARAGTAKLNNNSFAMSDLDQDGAAFPQTFNSSSSQLLLPAGGTVLFAGLYWGARLSGGTGGSTTTADPAVMSLRAPGDTAYRTVTSSATFGPTSGDRAYQRFADVTDLVRAAGSGSYWGANVAAGTGEDRYAGWSLVVVYRSPALPLRNLTVFDGFADVGQGNPQSITVSGFITPRSGPVASEVGLVAYEGDFSASGDSAYLDDTQLATPTSPGTNLFNGANERDGQLVTTRDPADVNMLGFDILNVGTSGVLPNSATSATLSLTSTGDRYFPGVITTSINLYAPNFTPSTKSVTNLDGHDPAQPGDTLQYTVNLVNSGGDPAAASVVTDPLPTGTTYVPGSLRVATGANAGTKTDRPGDDQGEYDVGARAIRVRVGVGASATAGGVLGVTTTTSFSFSVTVDADAGGTTVVNEADLAYRAQTLDRPFVYSPAPVSTPVATLADLSLTKTVVPADALAGDPLTFILSVANAGPSAAAAVVLTDPLPDGFTLSSATPSQGTCSPAGGTLTCALGTVANAGSVTVTVVGRTSASGLDPSLTNTATVDATTADPDPSDNVAGATATLRQDANLSVTKSASPTSVVPGAPVTFALVVTNAGPSDASDVVVTDTVDDVGSVALLAADAPGATCGAGGATAQCTIGTVPVGTTVTVTVVGAATSGAVEGARVVDTATVTSTTPDSQTGDNTADATVTIGAPQSDLDVTKTGPAEVVAGRQISYTITATNDGPSDADAVTVTDAVPAGITVTSATSSRGDCTVTAGTVTCAAGLLPAGPLGAPGQPTSPGASVVVTIVGTLDEDAPLGSIDNVASATSTSTDPVPGNDAASAVSAVTGVADLSITKTAAPVPATAGNPVVFTLTVSNDGPSTARGISVVDTLPTELAFVSAVASTGSCAPVASSTLTCALADLAVGASATVAVTMLVPPTYTGDPVTQTATVSTTGTTDPEPDNDTADYVVSSQAAADLSLDKTAVPDGVVVAGGQITYTLTLANAGPSAAADTVVSDPLPAGTTFVSASPGCAVAGDVVTCTAGSVGALGTQEFTVVVAVDAGLDPGATVTNVATAQSSTFDPSEANNRSSVVGEVTTEADVSVTKTVTPASAGPGDVQLVELVVTNDGPSAARDVLLDDRSTTSFSIASLTGATCELVGAELECALDGGPLDPGAARTVIVTIAVDSSEVPGAYTDTAAVSTSTPDTEPGNDESTAPITVTDPVSDVSLAKESLADLVAGGPFSYQITVGNEPIDPRPEPGGRFGADAQDVVVTDAVPPGLTATSAVSTQGTCTIAAGVVTCEIGTLPGLVGLIAPLPAVVTVSGIVDAAAAGDSVTNTATVTSSTTEANPANNTAGATAPLARQAALAVTKTADVEPIVAGGQVAYTITVTNAGPSDALGVTVADALPAEVGFDASASDPTCAPDATGVSCALGTVPAGQTVTVQVGGQVDPAAPAGTVTNTATVSSAVDDPDAADNVASATSTVDREADLAITKTADTDAPTAGGVVVYTLAATNSGPSVAQPATITDTLPAGATLESVTPTGDVSCTSAGTPVVLTCATGPVGLGAAATVTIGVLYPDGLLPGRYTNAAAISSPTPDPEPGNNAASVPVDLQVDADTAITKTVVTDPVVADAPVTFRLAVTNRGPSIAPATVLTDTIPTGFPLVSATVEAGAGGCGSTTQEDLVVVTCDVGALPAGASASVLLTLAVPAGTTGSLANTAYVGSAALDPVIADNVSTATAAIVATPVGGTSPPPTAPSTSSPSTSSPVAPTAARVVARGTSGGTLGQLPDTGVDVLPQVALALALVAAGSAVLVATGRRRG